MDGVAEAVSDGSLAVVHSVFDNVFLLAHPRVEGNLFDSNGARLGGTGNSTRVTPETPWVTLNERNQPRLRQDIVPDLEISRAIRVLDSASENIAHLIQFALPLLGVAAETSERLPLLVPDTRSAAKGQTLFQKLAAAAGYGDWPSVTIPRGRVALIRECHLFHVKGFRISLPHLAISKSIYDSIASTARMQPPHDIEASRIYVSRSKATRRRILNETETIQPILAANKFQSIHLEDLPFIDQVQVMSGTSHVIAPHGAGLAHVAFVGQDTRVGELHASGSVQPHFFNLTLARGAEYTGHHFEKRSRFNDMAPSAEAFCETFGLAKVPSR